MTEDDVLHVEKLPTFNGRISKRESELLMSYLTVPYLRIPLVLNFFAQPERVMALGAPELRHILDCVVFEPGEWQKNDERNEPDRIPAVSRDHLFTPVGLLFNELRYAADTVVKPVLRILELALELDTGKYNPRSSPIILYITRLIARIESYFLFLLEHQLWKRDENRVNQVMASSHVRGLECPDHVLPKLHQCTQELRNNLRKCVWPVLQRWLVQAIKRDNNEQICTMHAHIALLLQNTPLQDLDKDIVMQHVCAQMVVNTRYTFKSELHGATKRKRAAINDDPAKDSNVMDIPETQIFDLFQNQRKRMFDWMEAHPKEKSEILEAVERVLTQTGTLEKR